MHIDILRTARAINVVKPRYIRKQGADKETGLINENHLPFAHPGQPSCS